MNLTPPPSRHNFFFTAALLCAAAMLVTPAYGGSLFSPDDFASLGTITSGTGALTFDTGSNTLGGGISGSGVTAFTDDGTEVTVFTFDSIDLTTAPTLTGDVPIVILSKGDFTLSTALNANGSNGSHRVHGVGTLGGKDGGDSTRDSGIGGFTGENGKGAGGSIGATSNGSDTSGGAGYGGAGGDAHLAGGGTYGTSTLEDLLGGSGAGATYNKGGGAGGGAIELGADGHLLISGGGSISVGGGTGGGSGSQLTSGGGSGGAVLLFGESVTVAGTISADGGDGGNATGTNANGGGGGGGRIAIYSESGPAIINNPTVNGGVAVGSSTVGQDGSAGTVQLVGVGALESVDSIVGQRQSSAPALDYYPDASNNNVGMSGSTANNTRQDRNIVFGFALPTLAPGAMIESAILRFEITGARDQSNANADLDVYLLDTANPDGTGDDFFFHGASDPDADVEFIDSVNIAVGTSQSNFADDAQDQAFVLTGDALALLEDFYTGSSPDQAEAFFRFNLSIDPALGSLNRYNLDLAANESWLEIIYAVPSPAALPAGLALLGVVAARRRR